MKSHKIIEALLNKMRPIAGFGEKEFLRLTSNESAYATLSAYFNTTTYKPLMILGSAGNGKTHLVSHFLFARGIHAPQVSPEFFFSYLLTDIKVEQIDVSAIQKKFPVIFFDDTDMVFDRPEDREAGAKLLFGLALAGCKVILTQDRLYNYPNERFELAHVDEPSESDAQALAIHFFARKFARYPESDEDLNNCAKALTISNPRSIRTIEANLHRLYLVQNF